MKQKKTNQAKPPGAQIFTVAVTDTRHSEWQGFVCGRDSRRRPFSSVLELLRLLDRQIRYPDEKEEEQAT